MTKAEIISAFKAHGGKATMTELSVWLKKQGHSGYVQHILKRMLMWREVRFEKRPHYHEDGKKGCSEYLYEYIGDNKEEWEKEWEKEWKK